jgi:deoxyribonuclease-4
MVLIGVHIDSNIKNIKFNIEKYKLAGCNIIQLFVDPVANAEKKEKYKNINKLLKSNNMDVVVHISYTINCSQNWDYHSWWIKQFISEIDMANLIGAFAVVVHLGKQLDLSLEESYNNMYTSLLYVHNQTKHYDKIKILIETSTGQGSEICYKLEDLAHFYRKLSKHNNESIRNRFGICIDTCHIFAAGYDLRTEKMIELYIDSFNEQIGLEHVGLVHINDAKKELGSRVDRHANIGKGFIGKKGIELFALFFKKLGVPMILETPMDEEITDVTILLQL